MTWEQLTAGLLQSVKLSYGETCIHKPAATAPDTESFTGVFDSATAQVNGITGLVVMTAKPRLLIQLADLTVAPVQGDKIEIRGNDYKVIDVIRDGHGGAEVSLHKV